jgi:hypothetical protein
MKKILSLLMFPVLCFGQNNNTNVSTNVTISDNKTSLEQLMEKALSDKAKAGVHYLGNGQYEIIETGKSSLVKDKKVKEAAIERLNGLIETKQLNYEIISEDAQLRVPNRIIGMYTIKIQTYNKDGSIPQNIKDDKINKDNAKNKLIELKKLKDDGIINQEEYDKAAAPHKKILLGL